MNNIRNNEPCSFAIVIGINAYHSDIGRLQTAVKDAEKLSQVLSQSYHHQVHLMLDEDATLKKLNHLIEQLQQSKLPLGDEMVEIQENDRVFFYFAGHGIALDALESDDGQPNGYLIPQDANKDENSFLPMQKLHDALVNLPNRHLLVILDCCFAGAFRWASLTREPLRRDKVYLERYERYLQGSAQQVITSAAHNERALDVLSRLGEHGFGSSGEHSPFAEALIDALSGNGDVMNNGVITATELYLYLHHELGKKTQKQTPGLCQLKNHDSGEYIFLLPDFDVNNLEKAPLLDESANPYRGLNPYEREHSHLFFGRQRAVEALKAHLSHPEKPSLTAVLGASGIGKSSLVKAGLLPVLPQERWHILEPITPGISPFAALAKAISPIINESATSVEVNQIHTLSKELQQPEVLKAILKQWKSNHSTKLLLVIDQFEELITQCDLKEQKQFLALLKAIVAECGEQVHVIITLRSEFEVYFSQLLLTLELWSAARFVVEPMEYDELREAIEKPATEEIIYFEPPDLVNQLLRDISHMPGALPLLSFTLSELYIKYLKRRGSNRAMTWDDYQALGGVMGSLTTRATEVYEQLVAKDSAYEKTVCNVMLRMVALEGGALARRRVLKSELEYLDAQENNRVKNFLDCFCQARLIVANQDSSDNTYYEPAHDALVHKWDKLQTWIKREQETLTLQQNLTPDTIYWLKKNRHLGVLWTHHPDIKLLEQVLKSENNWLNKLETEFVKMSLEQKHSKMQFTQQYLHQSYLDTVMPKLIGSNCGKENLLILLVPLPLQNFGKVQENKREDWLSQAVVYSVDCTQVNKVDIQKIVACQIP
jgi:hypothetical protein